jgi:amino acid transporter
MLQQFEEVEPPQDEMALGRELQEAIVLYNTPAMVFAFWLSVATILVATIFVFRPTLFAGKIAMVGTLIKLVMLVCWVVEAFWTTFPGSSPFHVTGNGYFGSWLAVAFAAQMFYAVAPAIPEGRTSEVLSSKSVDAEVSKAAVEEDAMAL